MKLNVKHILTSGLLALFMSGCADSVYEMENDPVVNPSSISLSVIGNTTVMSRSAVVDPDDGLRGKQHVTRVHLFILESRDDDFYCVAKEDVKWKHLNGAMEGLETKQQFYTTEFQNFQSDSKYIFLAVGFDDTFEGSEQSPNFNNTNSVAAFGNPDDLMAIGSKLSESAFSLKDNNVGMISQSELFAGSETFTGEELLNGTATNRTIYLYRRVAGIAGYFKNVPADIKSLQLRLYTGQNTKAYLLPAIPKNDLGVNKYDLPKDVPDDEYIDYITSTFPLPDSENGALLSSFDLPSDNLTITLSSYLLPIAASEEPGRSTLEIVMIDNDGNATTRRVLYIGTSSQNSRSGTGIIDTPEDANDSKLMHYPIRANSFYRIGSKANPIDLSGSTSDIFLEIDPVWDEYYGGSLGGDNSGIGIDTDWGNHNGGSLNK